MPINADKPHLWKGDVAASVDLFNAWFLKFAPQTFRDTRAKTTEQVKSALTSLDNLRSITPDVLKNQLGVLPTLRMSTAPPIARDRLIGLAGASPNVVSSLEAGRLPMRMSPAQLDHHLKLICKTLQRLLDRDLFPWLERGAKPGATDLYRASTIIADRLTGAVAD
ncbi:MAG: XamI family restriction endonuclease, partial [bacterium]